MGKIILLNGPPSSGKDTAAKHIRQWHEQEVAHKRCLLDRMSMPIKRAFAGTMGLPINADGIVESWEHRKEEIIPEFGISYRQWQIDFSESFLKKYDGAIFGKLLAERIARAFAEQGVTLVVVPDCGFQIEIEVMYSAFDPEDILLIRPHREGFDFSRDSRSYVRAPQGAAVFDPMNKLQHEYLGQIEAGVKFWLEQPKNMMRERA